MIVAKDTLGTINTHVISGLFKINKIQTTKMRKHKLTSHKIYLRCSSKKCNAKINIIVKPEIPIEKVSKHVYKFGANTTDEMMLNINNYNRHEVSSIGRIIRDSKELFFKTFLSLIMPF